jgi:hypothetical protein
VATSLAQSRKQAGLGKQNGELLTLAEAAFDGLLTIDTNLRYQQNLAGRKIAVVVLMSLSDRLDHLRVYFPAVALAVEKIRPGEINVVGKQRFLSIPMLSLPPHTSFVQCSTSLTALRNLDLGHILPPIGV